MDSKPYQNIQLQNLILDLVEQVKHDLQNIENLQKAKKQVEDYLSQNFQDDMNRNLKSLCIEFKSKLSSLEEFHDISHAKNWGIEEFLYIMYFIGIHCNVVDTNIENQDENLKTPKNIISLQTLRNIEILTKYILSTIYFICLDKDAGVYLKKNMMRKNLNQNYISFSKTCQHKVLILVFECLLPLFKHEWIGNHLQNKYFNELFCGFLQLSFSPFAKNNFPDEVQYFRKSLNYYLETKSSLVLKSVLLLKGIFAQQHEKNYIQTVCQSFFIRRYLLNEDHGLNMIIDVCIELGSLNDLKHKDAIASLIAFAKVPEEDQLFNVLQPQILKLLHLSQEKVEIFHILALMLNHLSKRNSDLLRESILADILLPLTRLTEKIECPFDGEKLVACVLLLNKIFVELLPPNAELISQLENVISPLFEISILPPTCHIKSKAKNLLQRYLSPLETENYVSTLLSVIGLKSNYKIPQINPNLKLVPKLNSIDVEYQNNKDDWSKIDEEKIKLLIHILEKANNDVLVINFIESLVSYIDFTIFNNIETKSASSLLTDADISEIKFERFRSLVFVVGVISSASENEELITKLFYDLKSALSVVKILLETQHQECADAELSQIKDSFLISCVMLLSGYVTTLIQNGKIGNGSWDQFTDVVQCLKSLTANSENSSLVAISQQLLTILLTHGVILSVVDEITAESSKSKNSKKSFVVEDLNKTSSKSKSTQDDSGNSSNYKETLMQLYSPHIPIRGHALITLNKLIEKGDKETIENADSLLPLLEYYLKDEDSYIYLASVKALSSLSSKFPKKVITTLTKEFSCGKHKPETRMKIIEILTETARRLGEILPIYKNLFLNCVINGIKEKDSLIKASCLSNLGEICKLLHFSIDSVLYEVFNLVDQILKYDESLEVKRAAILLITLLLQGLGKDSIKVLHSLMLEIYRGLKRFILNSNDPVIVTHAELAMNEINEATKEFLLPKLNLTKKIYITEVPPNSF